VKSDHGNKPRRSKKGSTGGRITLLVTTLLVVAVVFSHSFGIMTKTQIFAIVAAIAVVGVTLTVHFNMRADKRRRDDR
jgi:hypothetical protein